MDRKLLLFWKHLVRREVNSSPPTLVGGQRIKRVLAAAIFVALCLVGPGQGDDAYATARCGCQKNGWQPVAWTSDGETLLAHRTAEGLECDCYGMNRVELWRTGFVQPLECFHLHERANPRKGVPCRTCEVLEEEEDFLTEDGMQPFGKYSVRDTRQLKRFPVRAKPLPAHKVRVKTSIIRHAKKKHSEDHYECEDEYPCAEQNSMAGAESCECKHLELSVAESGSWKVIWRGAIGTHLTSDNGEDICYLPSEKIEVWPSPNGKKAVITYWTRSNPFVQEHAWVDLVTNSHAGATNNPPGEAEVRDAGATHEVFRTGGTKEPWLNLRAKASGKASIKAKMSDGTRVMRLDRKTYGKRGWAYKVKVVSGPDTGTVGFAGKSYLRTLTK